VHPFVRNHDLICCRKSRSYERTRAEAAGRGAH